MPTRIIKAVLRTVDKYSNLIRVQNVFNPKPAPILGCTGDTFVGTLTGAAWVSLVLPFRVCMPRVDSLKDKPNRANPFVQRRANIQFLELEALRRRDQSKRRPNRQGLHPL